MMCSVEDKMTYGLRLWPLLALLLITACTEHYRIAVSQNNGEVFFEVEKKRTSPPCIQGLAIMHIGGAAIWGVQSQSGCTEVTNFRYGHVPEGWRANRPAPELEPGREYQVVVNSGGGYGTTKFRYKAAAE